MNRPTPPARIVPALASLILAASLLAGCGETATIVNADGDARRVSDVVEEFNEVSMDVKKSTKLFAEGVMPQGPEFKKYGRYTYFATGTARPSGDTATMEITLRDEKTSA